MNHAPLIAADRQRSEQQITWKQRLNFKRRTETTDRHRSTQIFLDKAVHPAGDPFVFRNLFLSVSICGFDCFFRLSDS